MASSSAEHGGQCTAWHCVDCGNVQAAALLGWALDQRHDLRPAGQVRTLVARQAYKGPVTVVALLPPILCTPVLGVDFKSGRQVQSDNEQIRHHDTSDDEHAAGGSERRCRVTNTGWLPSRTRRRDSEVCVGSAVEEGSAAGLWGPSRGDQK